MVLNTAFTHILGNCYTLTQADTHTRTRIYIVVGYLQFYTNSLDCSYFYLGGRGCQHVTTPFASPSQ